MSISDDLMWRYINLLSFKSGTEIQSMQKSVEQGLNPRDVKIDFAKEIVSRFHNHSEAENAHQEFIARFQKGIIPEDVETLTIASNDPIPLSQLLKQTNLTASTSESIRLVKQGGVKINGEKVSDPALSIDVGQSYLIQVGKRRIAKVLLQKAE